MIYKMLTPPGVRVGKQLRIFTVVMLCFVGVGGLSFLISYGVSSQWLYKIGDNGIRQIREGRVMLPFSSLIHGRMRGFWAYLLFCMGTAAANLRSFYAESKSIYVMKRLAHREVGVRCFLLPILAAAVGFLFAALLDWLCWLYYCHATPEVCIPMLNSFHFWEAF